MSRIPTITNSHVYFWCGNSYRLNNLPPDNKQKKLKLWELWDDIWSCIESWLKLKWITSSTLLHHFSLVTQKPPHSNSTKFKSIKTLESFRWKLVEFSGRKCCKHWIPKTLLRHAINNSERKICLIDVKFFCWPYFYLLINFGVCIWYKCWICLYHHLLYFIILHSSIHPHIFLSHIIHMCYKIVKTSIYSFVI